MPGFGRDGGTDRNPTPELLDALTRLLGAFREGTGGKAQPIVDLNFNLTTEGIVRVARALEPFDLAWLEVDSYDAAALAHARRRSPIPLCSGENLYALRGFRPYLEAGAMDVASVDVIWNGFAQSLKIAALAETHEVACAPHNYYSHLATFIAAQWCAAIPNVRLLEVDVDDVPWREELTTAVPEIVRGELVVPPGPGWGCDVREDVLRAHPSPRVLRREPPPEGASSKLAVQREIGLGEGPTPKDRSPAARARSASVRLSAGSSRSLRGPRGSPRRSGSPRGRLPGGGTVVSAVSGDDAREPGREELPGARGESPPPRKGARRRPPSKEAPEPLGREKGHPDHAVPVGDVRSVTATRRVDGRVGRVQEHVEALLRDVASVNRATSSSGRSPSSPGRRAFLWRHPRALDPARHQGRPLDPHCSAAQSATASL